MRHNGRFYRPEEVLRRMRDTRPADTKKVVFVKQQIGSAIYLDDVKGEQKNAHTADNWKNRHKRYTE